MNILSLFSGYEGAALCLQNAGIKTNNHYSSEVDKYAMKIANKHFHNLIQVGDVTKWYTWDIDWSSIDLVIGGSPCQGFSRSGQEGGTKAILNGVEHIVSDRETYLDMKSKGAEFLSQSYLFWEFILCLDLVKRCNPKVKFLLENVEMLKHNEDMITESIGVKPIKLNSSICSPQARIRNYWCNWYVSPLEEKQIVLSDILEYIEGDRTCIIRNNAKLSENGLLHIANTVDIKGIESIKRVYCPTGKCPTLTTMGGGHREPKFLMKNGMYRKATILELERIAGLPDNYTDGVSDTQRKKMIGNGWEIRTMTHIIKCLKSAL